MKKLSLVTLIVASVIIYACNGNSNNNINDNDSATSMMSDTNGMNHTIASDTGMVNNDTKDFINEAATGGMMEVELGNIAIKNAASDKVKEFGKLMVEDHTKINNQLKDLASGKGIELPATVTNNQQLDIDKLKKETGSDFDKDYVSMMVDDHQKDIDAFKDAADKTTDPNIKSFITNTIPILQKHLNAIQAIQKMM
jgi:putative membrane protein